MRHLLFTIKISLSCLCFLLASQPAAAHFVSVVKAKPVAKAMQLTLMADVSNLRADKKTSLAGRSYRLTLQIPKGVIFELSLGSKVSVTLPTIHNRITQGAVSSISKTQIEILLFNQVQLLDGQRLSVVLPINPKYLYQIPFQSIYSPRGITSEVFILLSDRRVSLVSVVPLQVLHDGQVIVLADQLQDANVVVNGGDNLVSGDKVQVIEQKEVKL